MTKITATRAPLWPVTGQAQVLDTLRFLLDGSLTEKPLRRSQGAVNLNDLAWVFVAGRDFRPVAVRTYATLEKKMAGGAVYFTPNTFYARRAKTREALRWLNALYVDIDDPDMTVPDVLDRCRDEGLPMPTLVNKTPNGMHVYWKIERVRATEKALTLYSALLRSLATAMDGDQAAATAERFLRIPTVIQQFNPVEYELQVFRDWRDLNCEVIQPETRETGGLVTSGLLHHPAVVKLLQGVDQGQRDNTAFTLALAFKAAGYSPEKTLDELTAWNFRNRPPLSVGQLHSKVRSAYQSKYHAPSAYWITQLSGVAFKYQVIRKKEGDGMAKKRPHGRPDLKPAARKKLLAMLRGNGGSIQSRSQVDLGRLIGVSASTTWRVVNELKTEGLLVVETRQLGKGRGAVTTYSLAGDTCAQEREIPTDTGETKASSQSAIHYGAGRVGVDSYRETNHKAVDNRTLVAFPGRRTGRDQGEGAG